MAKKRMGDYLDPDFMDWLRKMPPEIWLPQSEIEFLDYWLKEYKECKAKGIEVQFMPPPPEPPKPISNKEIQEFEKFIDKYNGEFKKKKPQ